MESLENTTVTVVDQLATTRDRQSASDGVTNCEDSAIPHIIRSRKTRCDGEVSLHTENELATRHTAHSIHP